MLRPERGLEESSSRGGTLLLTLFYNCFYLIALVVTSPYLLFKILTGVPFLAGLDQRLGNLPPRVGDEPCLWVHGVSVGELLAATHFVSLFQERHPDWKIVISTTTEAGHAVARKQYPNHEVVYYPLDLSLVVHRAFRRIRPDLVLLIELELWPNFLLAARRRGIPVALINGRISDRSFRGYDLWKRFLSVPIRQISLFCVQNKKYAARLRALGVPREWVKITGTMKYDTIVTQGADDLEKAMVDRLRIRGRTTVLIGGSTHPPEEKILLSIYKKLVAEFPELILILAPRRPARIDDVDQEIRDAGFLPIRKSRVADVSAWGPEEVLLIDTMGELNQIYSAADLVFVGGSLVPHGGQNMMEPAGLGKAVLFGSSIKNFQDSVDLLLQGDAAVMVRDADHLERSLRTLLENRNQIEAMGKRAQAIVRGNQGASRESLNILEDRFRTRLAPRT